MATESAVRHDTDDAARAAGEGLPRLLLVGPGGGGGVATVVERFQDSPIADRFEITVALTYRDGSRGAKLRQAASGLGRAIALLASRRVDIVYLHTSSGSSFRRKSAAAAAARASRRPYIVHVHAGNFALYYRNAPRWERALVRTTLRRAAAVVVLSEQARTAISALEVPKVVAIPNFVAVPADRARPSSPPQIVSLGRLGDAKGSRTLVRALALLGGSNAHTQLVLAGDGDPAPVVEEAQKLGIGDRVRVPGWIGPRERDRLLSTATIFALPSRTEALPMALLEAMAHGLPSVTTAVGGIPDVFEPGRHGYFVEPDDPEDLASHLALLLEDSDHAREMGTQARRDIEQRYSVDVVTATICTLIDDALRARGAS